MVNRIGADAPRRSPRRATNGGIVSGPGRLGVTRYRLMKTFVSDVTSPIPLAPTGRNSVSTASTSAPSIVGGVTFGRSPSATTPTRTSMAWPT